MEGLIYKEYVWPQNPHTYREAGVRTPRYVTEDGVTVFDSMSPMKRVITGEGTFFGADALTNFQALIRVFEEGAPGNLVHPIWGTRYCYFTGLELIQEPKSDFISYSFEFTCAQENGVVPK